MRARESLLFRSRARNLAKASAPIGGTISVSTKLFGRTYSSQLTFSEIKNAYGISLKSVKGALTNRDSVPGATISLSNNGE